MRVVERVPCLADVLDTREAYLRTKTQLTPAEEQTLVNYLAQNYHP